MSRLLLSGLIVVVVVALTRAIGSTIFGTPQHMGEILLHALLCAAVLMPVLMWISKPSAGASPDQPIAAQPKEENSSIDPVTNTLNLRGLTINLLESMALAERYDRDLAVVMLCVNDIEKIKQDHGDRAVETVLQMMGDTLVEALRIPDRSGRYQSNTFLLILPETDSSGAKLIAGRVLSQIVATEVQVPGATGFKVAASAGVAPFRSGDDPQLIIQRAQSALEEAKQRGQNQTVALA